jgi:predicted ATPase
MLYGRDALCEALLTQISGPPGRLLTLIGPPGVGKTSLLRQLAWQIRAQGQHVIWLDLRPLQTLEALRRALLDALEFQAHDARDDAALCETALHSEPGFWLFIDNAEHMVEPLRALVDALAPACPSRLIATSRRRVGARSETLCEIAPLPTLPPDSPTEALALNPAVALLRQRAAAAGAPQSDAALPQLAKLTAQLDGLPLAIELAAPLLRLFSPQALLERLEQAPRHAQHPQLNAVIETSWALLADWERAALAQLSVCARGATPAVAEQVIALHSWPDAPPCSEVLLRLCDHSLLTLRTEPAQRLDMLVSIQRFAAARLDEGEEREAHKRHALALSALARACGVTDAEALWSPKLTPLLAERDDLRLAWQRAARLGLSLEVRAPLGLALGLLALRAGDFAAAHAQLEPLAQEQLAAGEPLERCAQVWLVLADTEGVQWSHGRAQPWLARGLSSAKSLSPRLAFAFICRQIERHIECNELEQAAALERAAQELAWPLQDPELEAHLMHLRGVAHFFRDEASSASAAFSAALDLWSLRDRPAERGHSLAYRGALHHERGAHEEAAADLRIAQACFERVGYIAAQAQAIRLLATAYVDAGLSAPALEALEALRRLGERHHITWARGWSGLLAGSMYIDQGRWDLARRTLEEAILHLERAAQAPFLVVAHIYLGCVGLLSDDSELAAAQLDLAWAKREALRRPQGRAFLDIARAAWRLRQARAGCVEEARIASAGRDELTLWERIKLGLEELGEAEHARRRSRHVQAQRHAQAAVEQAMCCVARHGEQLERTVETRLCWRLLCEALPAATQRRLELERQDVARQALLIDAEWRALRAPGASEWSELAAESNQARLLRVLVEAHSAARTQPLEADELIARVWPGERLTPESAKNRLHVAITTLRKLGLREALRSVRGGYQLDPALRVLIGAQRGGISDR